MSLAGKDDRTVIALDDQGLMTLDMPWCRYHVHAWRDLGLPIKQLIPGTGEVDEPFHRVVTRTGSLELATLTQNRPIRELVVSADVVTVQVTVHYRYHVAQDVAVGLQRRGKRRPARPVPGFGLLLALTQPRVENDQFVVGGDGSLRWGRRIRTPPRPEVRPSWSPPLAARRYPGPTASPPQPS